MKILTLLTTLIITLASSNVFAKTFVCKNWTKWSKLDNAEKEWEGTFFAGQENEDSTVNIITPTGWKISLTYFGIGTNLDYKFYKKVWKGGIDTISIYSIDHRDGLGFPIYRRPNDTKYDFKIMDLSFQDNGWWTYCRYQ